MSVQFVQAQDSLRNSVDSVKARRINVIEIEGRGDNGLGMARLKQIEGTSIYAGKKSEVILLAENSGNLATNNSRQIFAKVPGLNVWESDGAGIQLGIGGRGLNPNRVSNFNTRQNGYDISADALGYPESYYTPPTEALERIEVVRGAASLQYGTQFGGFVNFKFKHGPENKKFEAVARQTLGSFGFYNAFTSIGGNINKLNYYGFFQYKTGDGWRPNSHFDVHTTFLGLRYKFNKKFNIGVEYTYMDYLAQQAGGLTDKAFEENPRQSFRSRNWFRVAWNLAAMDLNYEFNSRTRINFRSFGLYAQRDALGNLGRIDRLDQGTERNYLQDQFRNFGAEFRFLKHYYISGIGTATFLAGSRYYQGLTLRKQGYGTSGSDPDFRYLHPDYLEHSDYDFPSKNLAFFSENIFRITKKLSITPGIRFEFIDTRSMGYYNEEYKDLAGNILYRKKTNESRENQRHFKLAGIGVGYRVNADAEAYGNISQNYRSINFNDMRIVNPNAKVDPNLKDEKGYSADMGIRGSKKNGFNYDVGVFFMKYNDRIGSIQKTDTQTFQIYRFRTNISDSRSLGFEGFAECNLYKLITKRDNGKGITLFLNYSFIQATYLNSKEAAVKDGNRVEYSPSHIVRTGITGSLKNFRTTLQASYTSQQFTDATNTEYTSSAVDGLIPAYTIVDYSLQYQFKRYSISGTINNLLNSHYFTRRADGYPGPGIIPADGRGYFITLQIKI